MGEAKGYTPGGSGPSPSQDAFGGKMQQKVVAHDDLSIGI